MQHSLSGDGGYTVSLALESKLPEDGVEEREGNFTGVVAYYRDRKTGKQKSVIAGDQARPKRLLYLYANKEIAKRAMEREWARIQPVTD